MTRRELVILASALGLASCEQEAARIPAPEAPSGLTSEMGGAPGASALGEDGARLPLARVLAIVRAQASGEVLEVELDKDDGREVYEVAVLTIEDRKIEITLDARTGRIIEREED